jgi:hypothetical protein
MGDQSAFAETVGVKLVADGYVLSRSADGSVACLPHGLTNAFTRITRRTGISTHFHALRHFSATTAIAAGMDVRTVAGRLGHADPSVTVTGADRRISGAAPLRRHVGSPVPIATARSPVPAGRFALRTRR